MQAIILRGVSGCGKSTLAKELERAGYEVVSADNYFINPLTDEYNFDKNLLGRAHADCFEMFTRAVGRGQKVVVDNTNTSEKEISKYTNYLDKHLVQYACIVVENRHGNNSVHDVPEDTRLAQEQRLKNSIKLI